MKTMTKWALISTAVAVLGACASSGHNGAQEDIRRKIADAYGVSSFRQVDEIRYSFNVKIGKKQVKRSWIWQPRTDHVEYWPSGDPTTAVKYSRSEMTSNAPEDLKKVDAAFINDQYWLLFPYHLVWDRQTRVQDVGRRPLPIGGGSARCVVVTYPPTGGYTPGDVYELFIGPDYRLVQWIYRKGGAPQPTRMSTWEDHRKVGPLTVALNHQDPDADFRVWFTDVAVKLTGTSKALKVE